MTPSGPGSDDASGADSRLQAIYDHARASFAANLATIEAAIRRLRAGDLDDASRITAERTAHRLAGTAGTVGFPEATAPARRLETAFADGGITLEHAEALETEVAALRSIFYGSDPPSPGPQT